VNPAIDNYLAQGCGRCALYATPACKVHSWKKELQVLRQLVLASGLKEELKWGVPCYTHKGKNVLIIAAFKDNCTLSFFKGALLKDKMKVLEKPGENSQASRVIRFTDTKQIHKIEETLLTYIFEAMEIEEAGKKVISKPLSDYPMPAEFKAKLKTMPSLKKAFEALTPGRQKAYLLYFGEAKQSATREARIEKYMVKILSGKGFLD
jgi:uncharacterized protein YdeI (YjbR/CyaY-like superfamily)